MLGLVVSFMKSTRPALGEADVTQGVRTAQPAVFDHIVFRESMSIPTHFAILAHYSRMRQSHTKLGQRQVMSPVKDRF